MKGFYRVFTRISSVFSLFLAGSGTAYVLSAIGGGDMQWRMLYLLSFLLPALLYTFLDSFHVIRGFFLVLPVTVLPLFAAVVCRNFSVVGGVLAGSVLLFGAGLVSLLRTQDNYFSVPGFFHAFLTVAIFFAARAEGNDAAQTGSILLMFAVVLLMYLTQYFKSRATLDATARVSLRNAAGEKLRRRVFVLFLSGTVLVMLFAACFRLTDFGETLLSNIRTEKEEPQRIVLSDYFQMSLRPSDKQQTIDVDYSHDHPVHNENPTENPRSIDVDYVFLIILAVGAVACLFCICSMFYRHRKLRGERRPPDDRTVYERHERVEKMRRAPRVNPVGSGPAAQIRAVYARSVSKRAKKLGRYVPPSAACGEIAVLIGTDSCEPAGVLRTIYRKTRYGSDSPSAADAEAALAAAAQTDALPAVRDTSVPPAVQEDTPTADTRC